MKLNIAGVMTGVCVLVALMSAGSAAVAQDTSSMTLEELRRQAEANIQNIENLILERNATENDAVQNEKARQAFARGVEKSQAGDMAAAEQAWNEALSYTQGVVAPAASTASGGAAPAAPAAAPQPAAPQAVVRVAQPVAAPAPAPRSSASFGEMSLDTVADLKEAVISRINMISAEGEVLFKDDRLDEAADKFNAVLKLDPANVKAREYVESLIPSRRANLERIAIKERKAKAVFDRGNDLYARGDLLAARTAWVEASNISEIAATKMGIAARIAKLDTEITLRSARVEALNQQAVASFEADKLDDAERIFTDVLQLDSANIKASEYLNSAIPARREVLAQLQALEKEAQSLFAKGNTLTRTGDLDGALVVWQKALDKASDGPLKAQISAQIGVVGERKRQQEEVQKARIAGLYAEGVALFDVARLDEATTKFREVIALDRNNWEARQYIDHKIPDRKIVLEKRYAAEQKARAAMDRGNRLYSLGDFDGARAAWNEALEVTRTQN